MLNCNLESILLPDVEILNGLEWSAKLDKVFKENADRDPEILWQYFGSQTGFMRTLPGKYRKQGQILYWLYNQATANLAFYSRLAVNNIKLAIYYCHPSAR